MAKEDADSLFEKHNVQELATILENIKAQAEKKKYELRTMVGESYRDVIAAADSIGKMKDSAIGLVDRFQKATELCLVKEEQPKQQQRDQSFHFRIGAQIRLLVITPEQIWTALEVKKFLIASRVYLISEATFSDLVTLNQDGSLKNYPVFHRQWEVIKPLKAQIIQKAIETIQAINATPTAVQSALSSICVLQHSTIADTFQVFLSQRRNDILNKLGKDSATMNDMITICKGLVESMFGTITLAEEIFLKTENGCSLENNLKSIMSIGSEGGSVAQLYSDNTNMTFLLRFIPMAVRQYVPPINFISTLQNYDIKDYLHTWIASLISPIQQRLLILLGNCSVAGDLATIATELYSFIGVSLSDQKSKILVEFFKTDSTIWVELFHTPFLTRSEQIISYSIGDVTLEPRTLVTKFLKDEFDANDQVCGFVWTQKLTFGKEETDNHAVVQLETPSVTSIVQELKTGLQKTVSDIVPLIQFFLQKEALYESEANRETEKLVVALYSSTKNTLKTFHDYLQNRLVSIQKEDLDGEIRMKKSVFVGRISKHLFDSLDRLLKTLDFSNSVSVPDNWKNLPDFADDMKELFSTLYLDATKEAIHMITQKESFVNGLMGAEWNQKGIRDLPTTLSVYAADYLFYLIETLNKLFGFGLDKKFVGRVLVQLHGNIVDAFRTFFDRDPDDILMVHEDKAPQMYFDFVCLMKLVQPEEVVSNLMLKQEEVERKIMEFLPSSEKSELVRNIEENVQKYISRSSSIFEVLLVFQPPIPNQRSAPSSQEKHHVLQLAPSVSRFVLLPITMPTASVNQIGSARPSVTNSGRPSKVRPSSLMKLKPMKTSMSDVPLGLTHENIPPSSTGGKMQGIMNAMAQKTSTADLFSNASSYFSGVWGTNTPKRNK